jgi:hypothetical protein
MAVLSVKIAQLEVAEEKLEEAGVPRTKWIYISAIKNMIFTLLPRIV